MSLPNRPGPARGLVFLALLPLLSCAPPVPVPLTPSPPADEPPPREAHAGSWWTVRLRTVDEPAAAHEAASEAAPRFDEPVDVVPAGGQWHVHLGTFPTEEGAREMARLARARGYRSATVVPTPPPKPAPDGLAVPRDGEDAR